VLIIVDRKSSNGKTVSLWEFQFHPGATEIDRFKLELLSYTKYKAAKEPAQWRTVARWTLGWNSTIPWSEVKLPIDVYDEVREKIHERVNYMLIRAGNNPLPIDGRPSKESIEVGHEEVTEEDDG